MVKRALTAVSLALASVLFAPLGLGQSDNFAKTEFGHPDLQGTYTFRTITPLNRPRELEHMETLTPEQAAEWAVGWYHPLHPATSSWAQLYTGSCGGGGDGDGDGDGDGSSRIRR